MSVRIRFFGSGNAFAAGGRSHACIEVSVAGTALLLDCGGSSLPAITAAGAADAVDAIAVSHLHGDHFGGIPYLVLQQHFAGRTRPLVLAGPRELGRRLAAEEQALYPDFFGRTRLGFDVRIETLGTEPRALAGARVAALPVRHVEESDPHGLRVEIGGRLVAYSGDATWSDDLVRVAAGADLFICEATNWERDDPSHLSYRTLASRRRELACRRIVLTHLGAETLAHASELEMEHARDGLVIEV